MIQAFIKKVIGTKNDRELKRLQPMVEFINSLEAETKALSDDQLRAKIGEFRGRVERGEPEERLLPEVFAVVREASVRTLRMRHFDVQLIGGIVLYEGKIAEMKTGEGKTLVATLPLVLNSLSGKGGHLVTVNDYLAKRDAEWMGKIYGFLGLSVGVIVHGLDDPERQTQYAADITYGTNHEFGFDYLRDNMKLHLSQFVQRGFHYCIVDEVDSILIDEARTPLIISGASDDTTEKYYTINGIIPRLRQDQDYTIDEKDHVVGLTETGIHHVEELIGVQNLYDPQHIDLVHHVDQALRAHKLFKLDKDYIVKDGEVIIVDEFTGRLAEGRRFSDGLHQALEAKEGVAVESENQTLASITYQNYFRMYKKLAGMTGTAETEAAEFKEIYNLDVMVMPTNMPMIRSDYPDQIYKTEDAKFKAVTNEIRELHEVGRPVLVGTISIEKSEHLSKFLKREGIPHHVLNAKHHELEAQIVAQAGQRGAVTIATNMAGRGTDIVLGEGIAKMGGLHITGTERHEARRIDNQLRGRSGRQGDPGSSRFYLSLEDDLLRVFGGDRILRIMETLKMDEDIPIEHRMISRAIENAQKRLEGRNFDIRKHLLKYDDVMNEQRKVIYGWRRRIIEKEDNHEEALKLLEELLETVLDEYVPPKSLPRDWDVDGIAKTLMRHFGFGLDRSEIKELIRDQELFDYLNEKARRRYDEKEKEITTPLLRHIEHVMLLQTVDEKWRQHLQNMDHLREGINLRGYAQKDPLIEYKGEGFALFESMIWQIKSEVISNLFRVRIEAGPRNIVDELQQKQREQEERVRRLNYLHGPGSDGKEAAQKPIRRKERKLGRNDPCFCGSGKKFKKCHGQEL